MVTGLIGAVGKTNFTWESCDEALEVSAWPMGAIPDPLSPKPCRNITVAVCGPALFWISVLPKYDAMATGNG